MPILTWPDAHLATVCKPVGEVDGAVRGLAADMLETMYAAPGRGLAAPQVGRLIRLFVMDVTWKDGDPSPMVILDPVIEWRSEETAVMAEGCLSIPGILTDIERPGAIRLRWRDLDGAVQVAEMDSFHARCAQHEIDHLDGVVTLDRLGPQARAEAIAAYANG